MSLRTSFFRRVLKMSYRNAAKEAGRVGGMLADEGARKAALRMIGAHAAAGAVVGGTTNGLRGESVMRGAVTGGIVGGAIGRVGGIGAMHRGAMRTASLLQRRGRFNTKALGGMFNSYASVAGSKYGYLGGY